MPLLFAREGTGPLLATWGDWLCAYQRVTHYFRALDVCQPPPHLLAWVVLERAVDRAVNAQHAAPLRLAMEEVHALLTEQVETGTGAREVDSAWYASVRWRLTLCLADRGRRLWAWHDARSAARPIVRSEQVRPVPDAAPAPMVPQEFDLSPLRRMVNAFTCRFRQLRFGLRWKRRHA